MITIKPSAGADDAGVPAPDQAAAPETPPQAEEQRKPIPLIWIPATLCLGLVLAMVYLGGRILTAKSHTAPAARSAGAAKPAVPTPTVTIPAVAKPAVTPESPKLIAEAKPVPQPQPATLPAQPKPVEQSKPLAETKPVTGTKPAVVPAQTDGIPVTEISGDLALISPQAGQRYLQIGALGPKATRKYLAELKRASLDPHVAPGPSPDLLRVLVGPFEDKDLLLAVQARLDAAGIQNFIRKY